MYDITARTITRKIIQEKFLKRWEQLRCDYKAILSTTPRGGAIVRKVTDLYTQEAELRGDIVLQELKRVLSTLVADGVPTPGEYQTWDTLARNLKMEAGHFLKPLETAFSSAIQRDIGSCDLHPIKAALHHVLSRIEAEIDLFVLSLQSRAKAMETKEVLPHTVVLFLSADPTTESRLRLGEELREIQEKLQLGKLRERFKLDQRMSVRPVDISQALLDVQPNIVHFSGHGAATGELCFENQIGETHPVQPEALAALFEQFAKQVQCVLLNACYSEAQAHAIAQHVDYVVGMNKAIGDKAAIAFAIGFYQALGAGRPIEDAYKLGCVQIRLQSISEHLTPVLIKKGQPKA